MPKKYILLIVWPDGERHWSHWNVLKNATDALKNYEDDGCTGTVIATEDVSFLDMFF